MRRLLHSFAVVSFAIFQYANAVSLTPANSYSVQALNATNATTNSISDLNSFFGPAVMVGLGVIRRRFSGAQLLEIGVHPHDVGASRFADDFREMAIMASTSAGEVITVYNRQGRDYAWSNPQLVGLEPGLPTFMFNDVFVRLPTAFYIIYNNLGESRNAISVTLSKRSIPRKGSAFQPYYCFEFKGPQGIVKGACVGAIDGIVYPPLPPTTADWTSRPY